MKRFLILYFLTINFIFSENTNSFLNGNANFYYISKLEDQKIINLPYRMLNLSWGHQHDEFQLLSNFSLEYQPNINNYSFKMDDPQDFLIDLRELYITYLLSFGEIRIGKQIQTWGFVDENSPLDNTSAYDYNFLFESGTERKIGSNSLAMDIYLDNFKLGFTTTPFHSINRLPSSLAEFPIDLPVTPNNYQFMDIEKVNEYGVYLQYNSDLVDIATSYFSGYDRIYNLSGINIHETTGGEIYSEPDTVFAYRKTNVLGLSAQTFLGDLSVRMDLGLFNTKDQNRNVSRAHPNPPAYPFLKEELYRSTPIFEKSKYYQTTIQLEYPLPKGFDLFVQYFKYDTLSYNADSPLEEGESIDIPLFQQIDGFNPYTYFYPGMGSPLALMTRNAILLGVKKSLNERFLIQVRNLMDIEYKGYFLELVGDYKLSNKVSANFAINYINGDQEHPKSISNMGNDYDRALDYPLNQMEDFSHFRMQIKYSF